MNTIVDSLYRRFPKSIVDALDISFPKPLVDHIVSYIMTPHTFKEGDIHYVSYKDGWGYVRFDRVIIRKIHIDLHNLGRPTLVEYYISNFIFDYEPSGSAWGYPVGPLLVEMTHVNKSNMSSIIIRIKDIRGLPAPVVLYSRNTKNETRAFNIMIDRMYQTSIIRLAQIKGPIVGYCVKNNLLDVKLLIK